MAYPCFCIHLNTKKSGLTYILFVDKYICLQKDIKFYSIIGFGIKPSFTPLDI